MLLLQSFDTSESVTAGCRFGLTNRAVLIFYLKLGKGRKGGEVLSGLVNDRGECHYCTVKGRSSGLLKDTQEVPAMSPRRRYAVAVTYLIVVLDPGKAC